MGGSSWPNFALVHMLGFPSFEALAARNLEEEGFDPAYPRQAFKEALEKEGEISGWEWEWTRKDGAALVIRESARATKDHSGKTLYYDGTVEDITERKRAERLERALYELASVQETAASVEDLYRSVHLIVKNLMPAENFYVALYDEKENLLSLPYFVDEIDVPSPPQEMGKGLTAYVIRTESALLCDAALSRELIRRGEVELVGVPSACWLGVPLKAGGKTIGAMVLQHYSDPKAYGERERQVLEYVSSQVAAAIERKRAEDQLFEAQEVFRALVETSPDIIARYDRDCRRTYVNPAYLKVAQISQQELLDTTPDQRSPLPASSAAILVDLLHRVARNGIAEAVDVEWPKADDIDHWYNIFAFPEFSREGQVLGVMTISRDITDRKRIENALKASERRFALFMKNLPVVAVIRDLEGRYEFMNEAWEQATGLCREDYIGKSPSEVFPGEDALRLAEGDRRLIESGEAYVTEIELHHPSGPRWWLIHRFLLDDGGALPAHLATLNVDITERKRAEEALRESEEKFSTIFRLSPVAMSLTAVTDGQYRDVNEVFLRDSGFTREEIIGKSSREFTIFADVNDREGIIRDVLRDGSVYGRLCGFRTKGGNLRRCLTSTGVISIGGERFFHHSMLDVTDLEREEEALRQSEANLRAVLASTADGVLAVDSQRQVVHANQRFYEIWRIPKEVTESRRDKVLLEYVLGELAEPETFLAKVEALYESDQPDFDTLVFKDGRILERSSYPMVVEGSVAGRVWSFSDVTERKRAEQALRKSEERFRFIVENAPGLVFYVHDKQDHYSYISPSVERVLGHPATFFHSPHKSIRTDHPMNARAVEIADQVWKTGVAPPPYQVESFHADGRKVIVEAYESPIITGGEVTGILGLIIDVTERKRADEEIQRLNAELKVHVQQRTSELVATTAELDGFSYSVSHDLRAPLRSIDGWSAALLEDYGERLDATGKGYLETVRSETKHMGLLIDGLLQISRATRREMTWETLDLSDLAKAVAVGLAREDPERKVQFVIPEEVVVEGDAQLLRIVLHSLLDNAWKFTRSRPEAVIEFGVTRRGGVPAYFVRDNGVGFDAKFANKLFQPFQHLHRKEEYPGSGIGLATVQRVVHRHGGKVWAEGEVDKGATFSFTLGGEG